MKITYQKEGIGPKRSLKRLQRFNLTLWKILRFVLILFILSFGLFTFVSSKQSPDLNLLPVFTPEEKETHTYTTVSRRFLEDHKAPSISLAILGQFLINKDAVQNLTYKDTGDEVILTFTFENLSQEDLLKEKINLEETNLFSLVRESTHGINQHITTRSSAEVFLYSQTITPSN